jgi:hemolysin-activating ACP:hemolysin acyltransferase
MSLFSKKSKDQPPPAQAQQPAPSAAAQARSSPPRPNGAAVNGVAVNGAARSAQAAPSPPDMEAIKKGVERSRRTLVALGEIVSVLMKAPEHRNMTLATLQAMVAPPIASGQFMVLTAHQKERGAAVPIAVAMWANVSDEIDRRLSQAGDQPHTMAPADWTSGKIAWLTVIAGDQRAIPALLGRLKETTLKDRVVKYRVKGEDGKMQIKTLPEAAKGQARQPQPAKF